MGCPGNGPKTCGPVPFVDLAAMKTAGGLSRQGPCGIPSGDPLRSAFEDSGRPLASFSPAGCGIGGVALALSLIFGRHAAWSDYQTPGAFILTVTAVSTTGVGFAEDLASSAIDRDAGSDAGYAEYEVQHAADAHAQARPAVTSNGKCAPR